MLERILKTGLHIIYQKDYISFSNALRLSNRKSLAQRRRDIIVKFSEQAEQSEKYSSWFCKNENQTNTRRRKAKYKPVTCRTTRYERTALNVMTQFVS